MNVRNLIQFLIILSAVSVLTGEQPDPSRHGRPPGPQDPLEQLLFPPELIVHHQNTIGLSEEQKELFKGEISRARAEVSDLEWELRNAVETMTSLLRQDHVSEGAVLEQLDTVLSLEHQIKKTHLSLVIRIKNQLSPEQQQTLMRLKERMRSQGKG